MENNDLAIVLEVEKESSNAIDLNAIFYRYAVGDFKLWFSQDKDSGNIYSVGLREEGRELEDFEINVYCNEEGREEKHVGYYPNDFAVRPRSYPMATDEAREFMVKMEKACRVLDVVKDFFNSGKHFALYAKAHDLAYVKVSAQSLHGDYVIFEELYREDDQKRALDIFKRKNPMYKDCHLSAELVGAIRDNLSRVEDELISRKFLLGEIQEYFERKGATWVGELDEDCKRTWEIVEHFRQEDGDLVSREGLLDAVLSEFGCDLAYFGRDLQFFQDAIMGIPAVSEVKVDTLISDAVNRSETENKGEVAKTNVDFGK